MGLFSSKKVLNVFSSVYNLAGDIEQRPDILEGTVLSAVLSRKPLGDTIVQSYLKGAGIRLRQFANWAETNYEDVVGLSAGSLTSGHNISYTTVAGQITPSVIGATVVVQSADIGFADYTYWVDQYIANTDPTLLNTAYLADMNEALNQITITYEDTTTAVFSPSGFDSKARYLYVPYYEAFSGSSSSVITGATVVLAPADSFPSTSGWTENSNTSTPLSMSLDEVTVVDVVYSDSTPPEHTESTTTSSEAYNEIHKVYEQSVQLPGSPGQDSISFETSWMYQDTVGGVATSSNTTVVVEDIGGGVTKTTTTVVTTESLVLNRSYRIDTQTVVYGSYGPTKIFIYKEGSGNSTLDAMFVVSGNLGNFFPFIPFRIDNLDVKDTYSTIYAKSKKAFKKATGGSYDQVRESILSNPSLGDIDYAYAVFGVSLNTKDNSAKEYLYQFFKLLTEDPSKQTSTDFNTWVTNWNAADQSWTDWLVWRAIVSGQENLGWGWFGSNPEPTRLPYPTLKENSLVVGSTNTTLNYDITLKWAFIEEDTGTGLLEVGRKVGELWFTVGTTETYNEQTYVEDHETNIWAGAFAKDTTVDVIYLNWQVSSTEWKRLTIRGLKYINMIYAGKAVTIGSKEALTDPVGGYEESAFVVPLHELAYKNTGLVPGTQMATACCYLMFNSYQITTLKFYERGAFRTFLVFVVVVLTIASLGSASGPSAGILGTNAQVGGSLGLAANSTAAAIVGAVVNMVAATILINIVVDVATDIWGPEVGAAVGTVLGFVAVTTISGVQAGSTMSASFGDLVRADNLMLLTNSVGGGYAEYMNASAASLQRENLLLQEEINTGLKEVEELMKSLTGSSNIDPTQILDALRAAPAESRESFLQRTLMVGSDIANLSQQMLNNFTEITLSTRLP